MPTSFLAQDIMAEHLLSHNAIVFLKDKPMRLRSGLVTPIYVDNRTLPSYPEAWRDIIETMASRIVELKMPFDMIAGVEDAGTAHGGALAYRLSVPFITVRKVAKSYGDKTRIDGENVKGKRVLIIEDHLSTGLSLLDAAKALREQGAIVTHCFAITNFDMPETAKLFDKNGIQAFQLLPFAAIVEKAVSMELISEKEKEDIESWLDTPWSWASQRGLLAQSTEN
ncbi:orotate phosphoribosyltransferase [Parasutterella muris]|uniref:Orotate phosphoribosyltransferase n=2 Tax=Parasutterella TaxID=577310 RepID=A0A6L6YJ01_9BURK|nr:phosphoribosyltransferase family protein [Parasutterella muris]MVX57617.1 orotate phosphoribosyltransferase [Parasutterella muris]